MDAFSYLSVLLSIVVGLAVTQVLQGYRALLLSRGRVALAATPLVWSFVLLVVAAQIWWTSFDYAARQSWSFAAFAVLLLQAMLFYLMAGLILPDVPEGGKTDLGAHYRSIVTPFFCLFLGTLATSVAKDVVFTGHLPSTPNLAFHAAFALVALLALAWRSQRGHLAIAVGVAVLFGLYIGLLFAQLG